MWCACARALPPRRAAWRMDLAGACNVSLNVHAGQRYCSAEDVKTGDGECCRRCHRLRSRDVALQSRRRQGAVELKDMIVFLLPVHGGEEFDLDPARLAVARHARRRHHRQPLKPVPCVRVCSPCSWPFAATAALGASLSPADAPWICRVRRNGPRRADDTPAESADYLDALAEDFDPSVACAHWAGLYSKRRASSSRGAPARQRFIVFPSAKSAAVSCPRGSADTGVLRASSAAEFRGGLVRQPHCRRRDCGRADPRRSTTPSPIAMGRISSPLPSSCSNTGLGRDCWQRAARTTFPNDPCIDEFWGHAQDRLEFGHRGALAAAHRRDTGFGHRRLARGSHAQHDGQHGSGRTTASQGSRLNARCATSGRCYSHGTEMAGTIGGRMDNGIGVAGVAPNSLLLPIVISRVDHALLARLSTIAKASMMRCTAAPI